MTNTDIQRDANRLNVMLVGEESAGIQVLRILDKSHHNIVAVLASETKDSKAATMWNAAQRMGFPTLPAELVKQANFAGEVRHHNVDLLLNVHSLYLVNADIIRATRMGVYNMHPGPLLEYAGLNVPSWAIYNGETEHGVTVHQMVPKIDAGYIAYQERFPIADDATGFTLSSQCIRAGVPLISRLLDDASRGIDCIPKIEQDFSTRRYFNRHAPNDGWMSWNRAAADVVNHVRAASYAPFRSPWGVPKTSLDGLEFGVRKISLTHQTTDAKAGQISDHHDSEIWVATTDEWVRIDKIEVDGVCVEIDSVLQPGLHLKGRDQEQPETQQLNVAAIS